jgi:flagellar motor switch protein FliG
MTQAIGPSSVKPRSQVEKIAILLVSLGEDLASELLQKLPREDAGRILQAMSALGKVDQSTINQVQSEFKELMAVFKGDTQDGAAAARRIIQKSFTAEDAVSILKSLPRPLPKSFRDAERVDGKILWQILRKEHPQTIALILGHLSAQKAGEISRHMSGDLRTEVLIKLAKTTEVDPVLLDEIDEVLSNAIAAARRNSQLNLGGSKRAAEILTQLDPQQRQKLLSEIEGASPELGATIRAGMFTFEDIQKLSRTDIEILLRSVDGNELEIALRRCSETVGEAFFAAMSERRAEQVRDNIASAKPVPVAKIDEAQRKIAAKAAELIEKGTLMDPLDEVV